MTNAQFTPEEDLIILREVVADPPCEAAYGDVTPIFAGIAQKINALYTKEYDARSIRNRLEAMVVKFNADDNVARWSSGISEVITEKKNLLQEYKDLLAEAKRNGRKRKPKPLTDIPDIRDLAVRRFKEKTSSANSDGVSLDNAETSNTGQLSTPKGKESFRECLASSMRTEEQRMQAKLEKARQDDSRIEVERIRAESEKKKIENDGKRLKFDKQRYKEEQAWKNQQHELLIKNQQALQQMLALALSNAKPSTKNEQ